MARSLGVSKPKRNACCRLEYQRPVSQNLVRNPPLKTVSLGDAVLSGATKDEGPSRGCTAGAFPRTLSRQPLCAHLARDASALRFVVGQLSREFRGRNGRSLPWHRRERLNGADRGGRGRRLYMKRGLNSCLFRQIAFSVELGCSHFRN